MPAFYYRITDGIRITVRPAFLPGQSRPSLGHFVFAYTVRIENVGQVPAQLLSRLWRIHDSVGLGEDHEVEGEGVVGEQPRIEPGRIHQYQSYCILKSPSGFMEGHYQFVRDDGTKFLAFIPRFDLDAAGADRH
ncbi:MAG: Co2+/Mg2+ efflux protein ApaG [Gemmatimonadetes bacterium]|nr:Co2+/Mg2+ efflux protein ApaG [Gemmatimonadota bacterium]MCC7131233.1 Co2+/Mg2+ efflux protein ApaG [Gemmatimonadales bacterium]